MDFIGEIAGLATSFFFALTSIIFASTGRMVGSQVTNRIRLIFALFYLVILNIVLFREPLPFSAESSRWVWLGLSGVIGLSLGDAFYFQSLVSVGARLGSLLLSLAPIFGSVIAWIFFGETLNVLQITGIALALAGIGWGGMSHEEPPNTPHGHTRRGVFFGVLAGLGQATGLVLSKQGMFGEFSPFQANVIRMLAATIFIWIWTGFQGSVGTTFKSMRESPQALRLLALGALVGPVLGVSSSLFCRSVILYIKKKLAGRRLLGPSLQLPVSQFYFWHRLIRYGQNPYVPI